MDPHDIQDKTSECDNRIQSLRGRVQESRVYTDVFFRTGILLRSGLGINLIYVCLKVVSGYIYHSGWFFALAAYYFILAILRFSIIHAQRRCAAGSDLRREYRRYRFCGIVLLLADVTLAVIVALSVSRGNIFVYPGVLIYAMALYAFYTLTVTIINVGRFRKYGSPLLSAANAVSLTAAMVSMLALEIALTARFGEGADAFQKTMTSALGGVVCTVVLGMAIYMIVHASRNIRKPEQN